ncbi:MAG TPA: CHASE domain-containing protein [Longimicrobiales bacterium]
MTIVATVLVARGERAFEQARFEKAAASAQDRIAGRLELYIGALRGGAALLATHRALTPELFRAYVGGLNITTTYPGIQGIGWSERLSGGGQGRDVTTIRFLEPLDARNRAALGFDMYSEPIRREAMSRARDGNVPALSGPVTLKQEIGPGAPQRGVLLYFPVYVSARAPKGIIARRQALRGYVYAAFRTGDLFAGIFAGDPPEVNVTVFDGFGVDEGALVYRAPSHRGHRPAHVMRGRLWPAGRPWTLVYASEPTSEEAARRHAPLTATFGSLVTIVLVLLIAHTERLRANAVRANSTKDRFLASMSHELRTPLNAVTGYVDLLDAAVYGPVTPAQTQALSRIKAAGAHLLRLVDDVLTYARLDAGRVAYHVGNVGVAESLEGVEALVLPLAEACGIAYARDADAGLQVRADPDRLRQILLNLLGNAVKFSERGGRITVRTSASDDEVVIAIEDTGIGIPADKLATLFVAFTRVDDTLTRTRQGAGLGLVISRDLARGMGGDIEAESVEGVGSTFRVRLPRAAPSAEGEAGEAARAGDAAA